MQVDALLADLAVVFFAGVVAVLALGRLGLPPIVGLLAAGLAIGPHALGLIDDPHTIEIFAELGVALLLFTIGLEFSLDRLQRIGRFVAIGGTLQVGLTLAAAALGAQMVGLTVGQGVFWGYLAAVSSTAIVLRILADRRETQAPHGRFVVGVLIFQDLCIVPMMLTVPLLAGSGGDGWGLARVLGQAAFVVVAVVGAARFVVPWWLGRAAEAKSREVFVLSVLLVACSVAWATASMGLSIALGAFLAGIVIAETEFVHQVHADISPFRDALAALFFVSVGMLLDPAAIADRPVVVLAAVALLIAGKALLAGLAVLLMRFPARVAVLSGLALAQVGEFSFVLLRSGEQAGLVTPDEAATFLAASVMTMIATPLLVATSPRLAAGASLLAPLERLLLVGTDEAPEEHHEPLRDHVVIAGLGLGGRTLIAALEATNLPYVALELQPERVIAARARGHNVRYGDATSAEVLEHVADIDHARLVVLMVSDLDAAQRIVRRVRLRRPHLPILIRVHRMDEDAVRIAGPDVQVVGEDLEAAVEVVDRVVRASGVGGALAASAVSAARDTRTQSGTPAVGPDLLAASFRMQGVVLAESDWAVGRTLAEVHLQRCGGGLAVARVRDGQVLPSPPPDEVLLGGDTLFLAGTPEQTRVGTRRLALGPEGDPVE